mgnify:CR=1 FL=1
MDGGGSARRLSPASEVLSARAAYDLRQQVQRKGEVQAVLTERLWWPESRRRRVVGEG